MGLLTLIYLLLLYACQTELLEYEEGMYKYV